MMLLNRRPSKNKLKRPRSNSKALVAQRAPIAGLASDWDLGRLSICNWASAQDQNINSDNGLQCIEGAASAPDGQ